MELAVYVSGASPGDGPGTVLLFSVEYRWETEAPRSQGASPSSEVLGMGFQVVWTHRGFVPGDGGKRF